MPVSWDWSMSEKKGRVLFVDNDLDTCEMMHMLLASADYDSVTASTIADALWLAKNESFDLILLDWFFDDGTGIELCEMIRTFNPKIPIFFYTAVSQETYLKRIKESGAQGFFIKPVNVGELLQTLSAQISRRVSYER